MKSRLHYTFKYLSAGIILSLILSTNGFAAKGNSNPDIQVVRETRDNNSPRLKPEPISFSRSKDGLTILTLKIPEQTTAIFLERKTADSSYEQIFGIAAQDFSEEYIPIKDYVNLYDIFAQKDTVYSYVYAFRYKDSGNHLVTSFYSPEAGFRAENGFGELTVYGGNLHYNEETATLHIERFPDYSPDKIPLSAKFTGKNHLYLTDGKLYRELNDLHEGQDIDLKPFAENVISFRNSPLFLKWRITLKAEGSVGTYYSSWFTDAHYQKPLPKVTYALNTKVDKKYKPICQNIDKIIENADTPVSNLDKTNQKDQFEWVLGMSGVTCRLNDSNIDTLAVTDNSNEIPEYISILKEAWGIYNKADLIRQLEWLLSEGSSYRFSVIQNAIKENPKASAMSLTIKLKDSSNSKVTIDHSDVISVRSLADYTENRSILAFDYARAVWMTRTGYTVGYLTEKEAYSILSRISRQIIGVYRSWEDFGTNYCIGRLFTLGMKEGKLGFETLEAILADEAWLKNRKWINKAHIIIPYTEK